MMNWIYDFGCKIQDLGQSEFFIHSINPISITKSNFEEIIISIKKRVSSF